MNNFNLANVNPEHQEHLKKLEEEFRKDTGKNYVFVAWEKNSDEKFR